MNLSIFSSILTITLPIMLPPIPVTPVEVVEPQSITIMELALENPQTLETKAEVVAPTIERAGYSATSAEEIVAKKETERLAAEAAEAAKQAELAKQYSVTVNTPTLASLNAQAFGDYTNFTAPSGAGNTALSDGPILNYKLARPLPNFNSFGTPYGGHKGTDYMADEGTPIYSIAEGVVIESTETSNGWGVMVKVAHSVNGVSFTSLYAHMGYGTRKVAVGDTVAIGQLLGSVSDTGKAFGTHLHLEVNLNGSYINGEAFLRNNG